MAKPLKIAVDFDGTCVDHSYPDIGDECPGAAETLRELAELGHKIILYTMRSGEELAAAQQWLTERGIPLYGVNQDPDQVAWTGSLKCYANVYIDDAALGAPLRDRQRGFGRPSIDWAVVRNYFGLAPL